MTGTHKPRSAAPDARSARYGRYRANYQGRIVTVVGPQRIYPSGLLYYRTTGPVPAYVLASHLELLGAWERLAAILRRLDPRRLLHPHR